MDSTPIIGQNALRHVWSHIYIPESKHWGKTCFLKNIVARCSELSPWSCFKKFQLSRLLSLRICFTRIYLFISSYSTNVTQRTTVGAMNPGDVEDSIQGGICMNISSWLLICHSVRSLIIKPEGLRQSKV